MSDRAKILQRIQKSLVHKTEESVRQPDFSVDVYTKPEDNDLAVVFAQSLINVQGKFCFCVDEHDFIANLVALLKKKETDEIFVWDRHLQEVLGLTDVPFKKNDHGFLKAGIGITTCEALVARTGSVLVSSRQTDGRRLSIYPPIHIVVAFSSQLVYDVKTALQQIQEKYQALPSMLSLITGPSRTADIEKTLVLGAHGPKELHVFLVDDFQE